MEDCQSLDYATLYEQFKRHKQYLDNVSPATMEGYAWAWKAFEDVFKSGVPVTKSAFVDHIAALRLKGLTAVTVNTYIRSFNTFFRWLCSEGRSTATLHIPRLKEDRKLIEVFNDQHVSRLVSFKPENRHESRVHTIACLILDTGARIDEALSIERKDIDLDNLIIRIREAKGGKQRVVPMSTHLRKVLFRYLRKNQPAIGDLVFFTGDGEKLNQRNALRDFKAVCRRIGVQGPRCSFHTLRHTFGKNYIRNGGDVFRLQRILGHAKLEIRGSTSTWRRRIFRTYISSSAHWHVFTSDVVAERVGRDRLRPTVPMQISLWLTAPTSPLSSPTEPAITG
jgi:site-specific recombinase XerD